MENITIDILLNKNSMYEEIPGMKKKIKDRNKEFDIIKTKININNININSSYYYHTNKKYGNVRVDENILNEIKSDSISIVSFQIYQNIKKKELFGLNQNYILVHNFDNIFTIHKNFILENNNIRFILFMDDKGELCILFQYYNHDLYVSMLDYMEKRWYYHKHKNNILKNLIKKIRNK